MTTERTPRITDEMVRSFRVEMTKSKWTNQWNSFEAIEAGLKAALGPRIERRNGERRASGKFGGVWEKANRFWDSWPDPTKVEVPTCVSRMGSAGTHYHIRRGEHWWGVSHRRKTDITPKGIGPQGVNGSAPHSAQEGEEGWTRTHWLHMRRDDFCGRTHRRKTDPTSPKQEQNKALEIHVSEGMKKSGAEASGDWYQTHFYQKVRPSLEEHIYRAMEAQRLKEQGWDGLGPGGA